MFVFYQGKKQLLSHDLLAKTRLIFTLIHWEYRFLGETENGLLLDSFRKEGKTIFWQILVLRVTFFLVFDDFLGGGS